MTQPSWTDSAKVALAVVVVVVVVVVGSLVLFADWFISNVGGL